MIMSSERRKSQHFLIQREKKKTRIEVSCSRFSHALRVSDLSEAGIVELSPVKDT